MHQLNKNMLKRMSVNNWNRIEGSHELFGCNWLFFYSTYPTCLSVFLIQILCSFSWTDFFKILFCIIYQSVFEALRFFSLFLLVLLSTFQIFWKSLWFPIIDYNCLCLFLTTLNKILFENFCVVRCIFVKEKYKKI